MNYLKITELARFINQFKSDIKIFQFSYRSLETSQLCLLCHIKDVYAALMRRQMQWSHLISDKWAPRFHSLWSRSPFLVSLIPLLVFFVKEPCVWSLFSPSNLSWESKNTTLSRNYLWEKLLTTFFSTRLSRICVEG